MIWAITALLFAAAFAGIVAFGWLEECAMRRLCKLPEISFMDYLRTEKLR